MQGLNSNFRTVFLFFAVSLALVAPTTAQQSLPGKSDAERQKIERIVREYLLNNPELVLEVLQKLEAKQQAERDQAFKANLVAVRKELYQSADTPIMGNADGTTVIVEFSDYNCPYCKRMAPVVKDAISKHADLKIVMIEYPILGPGSVYAAKAALAAKYQGKYHEAQLGLFAHKGTLNQGAVDRVMAKIGLDMERLKKDMNRPELDTILSRNLQIGQSLGIQGTPAFIGGDEIRPGAVSSEDFAKLIDAAKPNE